MESAPAFLQGGGEMGQRIREYCWLSTPLGDPATWPPALRTALRILLTTNHPAFIFWGESLICFYNDAYARSLGPEQHPAILGMPGREAWRDIWHIVGPQVDLVMRGEGSTWHENHLVPLVRFGRQEEVYWTYSYGPVHDEDAPNGVGGVLVLTTETTPHVNAVAQERRDAAHWRAIFEHSPAFMCLFSGPQHILTYGNPQYLQLIGREAAGIGLPLAESLPEVVPQGYVALLDDVYRTGQSHRAAAAIVELAGVTRSVDFILEPIRDAAGTVTGVLVQGFDVSARVQAHVELESVATRLRLATNAGGIGIHEYDIETGSLVWDERVRGIWGFDATEPVTYDMFMAGLVEEDRLPTQQAVDRSLDPAGDGTYQAEYRVRGRDGRIRWVRAMGHVQFADGRATRMVGTVQDVTREKQDQAALLEADRQKDVFLATLAHELRNPLAPIRSAADLLAMPGLTAAQIAWVQGVIARQTAHMTSLLNDLLDVTRLSQGRMVLTRVPVDLHEILEAAVETVQPALQAKRHRLRVDVPAGVHFVHADVVRLCQVFTNLLANAIKYMLAGGDIDVSATVTGSQVAVSVRDTGDGIARDALSEIFGMFRQSKVSLERAEGGLGIGLALVRAIVELHGGSVRADSPGPGHGSTFTVTLPLLLGVPIETERGFSGEDTASTRVGQRVLLVDDSRDAADSLAVLLGSAGFVVEVARNGAEALRVAETFQPEVMVVDIGMPTMNGYDVARAIRRRDEGARIRLLALTGWGQEHDRARALDAGFDRHLTKPVRLTELISHLR